jgi:hypothetical protein
VAGWKKNMHLIHKLSIMVNEFPLYYFVYIYICVTCVYYIYYYIICVCIIYICIIYIYVYTYIHTYSKMVFFHPAMFGFKMVSLNSRTIPTPDVYPPPVPSRRYWPLSVSHLS